MPRSVVVDVSNPAKDLNVLFQEARATGRAVAILLTRAGSYETPALQVLPYVSLQISVYVCNFRRLASACEWQCLSSLCGRGLRCDSVGMSFVCVSGLCPCHFANAVL